MNKDFLKKMLHDQCEPIDVAVKRKLAFLESDDVFSEGASEVESGSLSDADINAMFSDAFSSLSSAEASQSIQSAQPTQLTQSAQPVQSLSALAEQLIHLSEKSEDTAAEKVEKVLPRHKTIAEKIAALRGINITDTNYMRRKRPNGSF